VKKLIQEDIQTAAELRLEKKMLLLKQPFFMEFDGVQNRLNFKESFSLSSSLTEIV